jgi:hypothetical protein
MPNFISLKSNPATVVFGGLFLIEDEALHRAFQCQGSSNYDTYFERALRLGVYGLEQETIAAFLGRAENELDASLEKLKLLYKLQNVKERSPAKGTDFEKDLALALNTYITDNKWSDKVDFTGERVGKLPRRKVGDLTVTIASGDAVITIEAKTDKSLPLGDTIDGGKEKSADGQILLANANRGAHVGIIVFDCENCHDSIQRLSAVTYKPEINGFIVKVSPSKADYADLILAYSIARRLALSHAQSIDRNSLDIIVKKMLRDLQTIGKISTHLNKIETSAQDSLACVAKIRSDIKSAEDSLYSLEDRLNGLLCGNLTAQDKLDIYLA